MIAVGVIGCVMILFLADPRPLLKPVLLLSGFAAAVFSLWWAVGGGRTWI